VDATGMRLWIAQESVCETSEDSRRATAARNRQHHTLAVSAATMTLPYKKNSLAEPYGSASRTFYKLCQIFLVRTKSEEEQ
jgi:hypothetical protein